MEIAKNSKNDQNDQEIAKKSENDQNDQSDQTENLATEWLWKRPIWSQTTKNGNTGLKIVSWAAEQPGQAPSRVPGWAGWAAGTGQVWLGSRLSSWQLPGSAQMVYSAAK